MPLTNKLEFYYFFNQIKRIWKIGNDIFKCIFHSFDFYEFPENWKKKWIRTVVAVENKKIIFTVKLRIVFLCGRSIRNSIATRLYEHLFPVSGRKRAIYAVNKSSGVEVDSAPELF